MYALLSPMSTQETSRASDYIQSNQDFLESTSFLRTRKTARMVHSKTIIGQDPF